jgi:hypothetical protein
MNICLVVRTSQAATTGTIRATAFHQPSTEKLSRITHSTQSVQSVLFLPPLQFVQEVSFLQSVHSVQSVQFEQSTQSILGSDNALLRTGELRKRHKKLH